MADPFGATHTMPACPESEGAVAVAAITQRADLDKVVELLEPEDFHDPLWRKIWSGVIELHRSGVAVDIPAIKDWLTRKGLSESIDPDRIQQQFLVSPYVSDVEKHVRQVRQYARLRRLLTTCQRIAAEAYESPADLEKFITEAEAEVYRVASDKSANQVVHHLRDCVRDLFTRIQDEVEAESEGRAAVARTGIASLDDMIGALRPGQLIVVPARPSMGKTALLLNIAANVAELNVEPRLGAHVLSLESHRDNVTARIVSAQAEFDVERITQRRINPADWSPLTAGAAAASKLPITIDDRGGLSLSQIRASIRRAQAELRKVDPAGNIVQQLGLVCVDYLQLVRCKIPGGNREQEVGAVAYGLLDIAREFNVPVIALAQLSRACEMREDKRPRMSDIRESGAIEQAAHVVVALYRDEYYNRESEDRGIAEAIVLKSKDTRTGSVRVAFEPQWMRFRNLDPGDERATAPARSKSPNRGWKPKGYGQAHYGAGGDE